MFMALNFIRNGEAGRGNKILSHRPTPKVEADTNRWSKGKHANSEARSRARFPSNYRP